MNREYILSYPEIIMHQKFHVQRAYTFWVTKLFLYKLSCEISTIPHDSTCFYTSYHVRYQRLYSHDLVRQSQYCFWLVESLNVNQSCEWSCLQNSHMITYIKLTFYNLETGKYTSHEHEIISAYRFQGRIKHFTCSFQNLHKFLRYWRLKFNDLGGHGSTNELPIHWLHIRLICAIQISGCSILSGGS